MWLLAVPSKLWESYVEDERKDTLSHNNNNNVRKMKNLSRQFVRIPARSKRYRIGSDVSAEKRSVDTDTIMLLAVNGFVP